MKQRFSKRISSVAAGLCALSVCVSFAAFAQNKTDENAVRETVAESSVAQSENADVVVKTEKLPYIQYTFDNANNPLENSGASAADETKDYTLKIKGNAQDWCQGGVANLADNGSFYLTQENNLFVNDVTDFTIAIDVDAKTSSWYSSIFSWDAFTSTGDSSSIDKYTRLCVRNEKAENWLKFSDRVLTANNSGNQWDSYAKGMDLYAGDKNADSSGALTLVMSLDADSSLKVRVYNASHEKVGEYVNNNLGSWSL